MEIIKSARKGEYYCFLMKKEGSNEVHLRYFSPDKIFEERIICWGGTSADISELGVYCFGMNCLNVNAIFGYNIEQNEYRYSYKGVTCVKPIEDDGIVLDLLIDYDNTFSHVSFIYE